MQRPVEIRQSRQHRLVFRRQCPLAVWQQQAGVAHLVALRRAVHGGKRILEHGHQPAIATAALGRQIELLQVTVDGFGLLFLAEAGQLAAVDRYFQRAGWPGDTDLALAGAGMEIHPLQRIAVELRQARQGAAPHR